MIDVLAGLKVTAAADYLPRTSIKLGGLRSWRLSVGSRPVNRLSAC